jgi:hypothetical protein
VIAKTSVGIFRLSFETGELLSHATQPAPGFPLITKDSIFFLRPFSWSHVNLRTLKEIDRVEYRDDVLPLYENEKDLSPAGGIWMTEESIVWTTLDGGLKAVSRQPGPGGKREIWRDHIPDAIVSIGERPVSDHEYLYVRVMGNGRLRCYRSARVYWR